MQFAHVIGTIVQSDQGLRLLVVLDQRTTTRTVRDEVVERALLVSANGDIDWLVDQLTQETIGTDLALEGWEAVALGDRDDAETGPPAVTYVVRRLQGF